VDTGKLRYAAMDLPLERIHKQAFKAAEASHCAGEQGKYWEMHDRLFQHQRELEPWSGHAQALGLDVAKFDQCLASGRYQAAVRQDMAVARSAGATGTPSFVLGYTDLADPTKVKGITFLKGAKAFGDFKAEIDKVLPGEPVRPAE
jgi:protein-disulfide isomerase